MNTYTGTSSIGQSIDANGTRLWVEQRGEGAPVLLIAGLGDPHEVWADQLDGLSDRYRVIAHDNRGVGRTPMPPEGISVEALADDAAGVLRALGVERAHIGGFSGGGIAAMSLALKHPELVRSLVLVNTFPRTDAFMSAWLKSAIRIAQHAESAREFLADFYLWVYSRRAWDDGTVDALIEESLAYPYQQSTEDFCATAEAFLDWDASEQIHRIEAPALVVHGEDDAIRAPGVARDLASRLPNARLELIEEQGHQPFQEDPERFNALVDEFWREVEAAER